jgi:hypothetical protein
MAKHFLHCDCTRGHQPTNRRVFPIRQGNATFVPGAPLRDDFMQYFFDHAHVKDYIAGVANASYAVPDLPSTWFTAQYIADRGLRYPREKQKLSENKHSEKQNMGGGGGNQGTVGYYAFPLPANKVWIKAFATCYWFHKVWKIV